ncbi:MAG: alpha/beta hydrolase [Saprospiraceae bacterium]|nr:alpha/beta hydrolase [Saprospiraceae bacterium]
MIKFFYSIILMVNSFSVLGQFLPDRYINEIFPTVTETTNVLFSSNVPRPNPGGGFYESVTGYPLNVREYQTTNVNLYMNIFKPVGDTIGKRPVIIICFGGGFVAGSKDHWSMRLIAQGLARRGYVTALIDYRLGMNMFDQDLAMRAVYRGIQDGRSAVRFFRADASGANNYRVDPDQIFIGGHSAGAFVALHNAFLDKETERPLSTYAWLQSCGFLGLSNCACPNQGCLDCVGNNQSFSGHANALFSLAGAVGSTAYIESAIDPSALLFHSQDDGTVPYTSGEPFGDISYLVVGSDLPIVYGSLPISQAATGLGLPYQFNSYTNRGHGVHEATSNSLYDDILPNVSGWFYNQCLKPAVHTLEGNVNVCNSSPEQTYSVESGLAKYFEWNITGGTISNPSITSHTVDVIWDLEATSHSIQVTPYNKNWAKGEMSSISVTITTEDTNIWMANDTDWTNRSNWSLLSLPQQCHHVIISENNTGVNPVIPQNMNIAVRSIITGPNKILTLLQGATLYVKDSESNN